LESPGNDCLKYCCWWNERFEVIPWLRRKKNQFLLKVARDDRDGWEFGRYALQSMPLKSPGRRPKAGYLNAGIVIQPVPFFFEVCL